MTFVEVVSRVHCTCLEIIIFPQIVYVDISKLTQEAEYSME